MTTRVALSHRIDRRFNRHVRLSTHWLRLRPAPHCQPEVEAYSLRIDTNPHFINWLRDPFENHLGRLDFPEQVNQVCLEVELLLKLNPRNPFDFLVEADAARYPLSYSEQHRKELAPYLRLGKFGPHMDAWLARLPRQKDYIVEFLGNLNLHINNAIALAMGFLPGPVDCESVLRRGTASAWEIAWLAALSLRALGLATRFTSGYKVLLAADPTQTNFASLHAWTEVFLPGAGWIGLDPAAGVFTTEAYVPLACAPDPLRAIQFSGYREDCDEQINEQVQIRILQSHTPARSDRASMPVILRALGNEVDRTLMESDTELATSMELAFVAAAKGTSAEWTTAAIGADKRRAAEALATGLARRLAPGAAFMESQGEWFAGEGCPRWRLSCLFRDDGKAICESAQLATPNHADANRNTRSEARALAIELLEQLQLGQNWLIPAYEDGLHELASNPGLLDFAPNPDELNDPFKRQALAERLSSTLGEPVGFVIPLRWDYVQSRWSSGQWRFRRGGLFLTPGSSQMGYRLPLNSLATAESDRFEPHLERSPFEERPADPGIHGETSARHSDYSPPMPVLDFADAIDPLPAPKTALCVELRNGRLSVFIPPLSHLEHFLALTAAIDRAARKLDVAVTLEGYDPAEDYRLRRIVLEPDCGVLRVKLPPARSLGQQYDLLKACYDEAEKLGLHGQRVLSDGSMAAAGGGVSVTVGSDRPADSPFLHRPELLRKLIAYWQRHPSLSYFFADRSIGPGGFAPRPDEGRDDALYELGIALARIPSGKSDHPWIADRLLRHLLADPAGNIHRAEINIDQLYPPHRQSERLGRVMLRCFEMPPSADDAALQAAFIKGVLAMLNGSTDSPELVDWGHSLHDRFMLPYLLWQDMSEILRELNNAGFPFPQGWFREILDANLPVVGDVQIGEIGLQLRLAREPWPLLAEEIVSGNIARFVDSAAQRIQVLVTGLPPDRYVLACNGQHVPLQATPTHGEYVAGVRFKAWNPTSTLHPTRFAVAGLQFDLIDRWNGRAVGSCCYFPAPPDVWGTAGYLPRAVPSSAFLPPAELIPQVFWAAPWSKRGRFSTKSPPGGHVAAPRVSFDSRHPYLLDLIR